MKTMKRIAAVGVFTAMSSFYSPLLGADANVNVGVDQQNRPRLEATVPDQGSSNRKNPSVSAANRASSLIGMEIRNQQNEKLGEISDVVLDLNSGRISYAVVSVGGFLGIGEKIVAIPPRALRTSGEERILILNADREQLQNAPAISPNNWPDLSDPSMNFAWMNSQNQGRTRMDVDQGRSSQRERLTTSRSDQDRSRSGRIDQDQERLRHDGEQRNISSRSGREEDQRSSARKDRNQDRSRFERRDRDQDRSARVDLDREQDGVTLRTDISSGNTTGRPDIDVSDTQRDQLRTDVNQGVGTSPSTLRSGQSTGRASVSSGTRRDMETGTGTQRQQSSSSVEGRVRSNEHASQETMKFRGRVRSIDYDKNVVTIESREGQTQEFCVVDQAQITIGRSKRADLIDIKPGYNIEVNYQESQDSLPLVNSLRKLN